ncbi:DUF427 domain-containing protein [Microbacterium sp. 22179]|jgi:uncharacterized protein (DUF427 family)|uniref:DUF427 domain-containing protein n=1 Tax=unclassified Microbacterium TaxID=2609290 RepID=UPI00301AB56B|nr:DUF427 domain-containing protein [Microbacterium sp.]
MKAVLAGTVIAEADEADLFRIEGNWYFPPASITPGALVESPTPYTCPWKGAAQYFSVEVDGELHKDLAWSYPTPYPTAFERVGGDFSGYVAFDPSVEVSA